jgi:nucleoside-triphosphatase THEP1
MKKLINFLLVMNYRRKVRRMNRRTGFRYFKRACRKANRLSKENDGKRYRVFLFDKYRVWTREDVQRMKNQGIISKKEETGILSKNCFYDTTTGVNTHPQFSNRKI